jgi:hypothetical protein
MHFCILNRPDTVNRHSKSTARRTEMGNFSLHDAREGTRTCRRVSQARGVSRDTTLRSLRCQYVALSRLAIVFAALSGCATEYAFGGDFAINISSKELVLVSRGSGRTGGAAPVRARLRAQPIGTRGDCLPPHNNYGSIATHSCRGSRPLASQCSRSTRGARVSSSQSCARYLANIKYAAGSGILNLPETDG